jgi:hypothetical protein
LAITVVVVAIVVVATVVPAAQATRVSVIFQANAAKIARNVNVVFKD